MYKTYSIKFKSYIVIKTKSFDMTLNYEIKYFKQLSKKKYWKMPVDMKTSKTS